MEMIIEGKLQFGVWADHVRAWKPYERPNTLLLKYEDMRRDLPATLQAISKFLDKEIVKDTIPPRNTIASVDGRWVRPKSNWREEISDEMLAKFNSLNKDMLEKMKYLP